MDRDRLIEQLARARRRRASAYPFSPEWAAADDEVEELEAALGDSARPPSLTLHVTEQQLLLGDDWPETA